MSAGLDAQRSQRLHLDGYHQQLSEGSAALSFRSKLDDAPGGGRYEDPGHGPPSIQALCTKASTEHTPLGIPLSAKSWRRRDRSLLCKGGRASPNSYPKASAPARVQRAHQLARALLKERRAFQEGTEGETRDHGARKGEPALCVSLIFCPRGEVLTRPHSTGSSLPGSQPARLSLDFCLELGTGQVSSRRNRTFARKQAAVSEKFSP